jgi:exodeoxyribonuclease V alpha subunit
MIIAPVVNMKNGQKDLFSTQDTVSGAVERVTFHSAESGFCVLQVKAEDRADLVTVVGTAPVEINAGEWVRARGTWVQDPRWGPQLKAEHLETATPGTLEGMRRYLGSGLVPGIGPHFADRLVDTFGDEVFQIIEFEPERLREVPGIGAGRAARITASWGEQQQVRRIMVFLHSHGVGTNRAFRIYKQYGQESIERLQQDPYCLVRDIHGMGFQSADAIAANLGISGNSPQRLQAGVEHVLQELTGQGHCAFPRAELAQRSARLLEVPDQDVEQALEAALQGGRLVPAGPRPEESGLVALARLQQAERELGSIIHDLAAAGSGDHGDQVEKDLAWVAGQTGLELAAGQRRAAALALQKRVLVITGGPGVGKTTLLNSILKIHQAHKRKVVACAPTGRAARRLRESTGIEARTIHRLLEFQPTDGTFKHGPTCPLQGDVFVVDEFSMVDAVLAWQLIRALPPAARLLLVGDRDQLPSVGPGRVLGDLLESERVPVAVLDEVFRQAAGSAIVTNAHRINHGEMPLAGERGEAADLEDFYFIQRDDSVQIEELLVDLVSRRLPRRLGIDPVADIQVLTPMRRGNLGTNHLNTRLQEVLNPVGPDLQRQGVTWRVGDRVMQTVNNYDKDIFNGDTGHIVAIDAGSAELQVRFEDRQCTYAPAELDELVHCYAATIHKSQGSEYPVVVVPLHGQHHLLLQRNLLYTAVTRGKKLVVLVGSRLAVGRAVATLDSRQRVTTLGDWLRYFSP